MNKETILKAVEHCLDKTTSCIGCPLVNRGDVCGVYLAEYISGKENEPAPAGTETNPEVSSNDTNNISHLNDSTFTRICQEAKNIYDRFNHAFDNDLESNTGIRLYGEAMGLLEAQINKLKGEEK